MKVLSRVQREGRDSMRSTLLEQTNAGTFRDFFIRRFLLGRVASSVHSNSEETAPYSSLKQRSPAKASMFLRHVIKLTNCACP